MTHPKIGLLILQPTPFCNINCSYCYLPNRDVRARMSPDVFVKILDRLTESDFIGEKISFVWHAGEPPCRSAITLNCSRRSSCSHPSWEE